ncbi:MAG: hypothetical protein U0414_08425 [Polyangiaceae bacterium]
MKTLLQLLALAAVSTSLAACAPATPDDEVDEEQESSADAVKTYSGVNGGACYASDYNCKLRVDGGNRIAHVDGTLEWGVNTGVNVLDGNGDVLGVSKSTELKFNYGQKRTFGGKTYVFAMSTSNKSSGWFPLDAVKSKDALKDRVGDATAHRAGLSKMACYEVRNDIDQTLAEKKVVYDTDSAPGDVGEAAGDYLPRVRANGKRSVNLIFNTPGYALGGPAIDHFPAGTKFQRLDVSTDKGPPSIDVPLWVQDANGDFKKRSGELKFIYGYVATKTGEIRTGWMAYPALKVSSGCK